jgi:hypothetical protein
MAVTEKLRMQQKKFRKREAFLPPVGTFKRPNHWNIFADTQANKKWTFHQFNIIKQKFFPFVGSRVALY